MASMPGPGKQHTCECQNVQVIWPARLALAEVAAAAPLWPVEQYDCKCQMLQVIWPGVPSMASMPGPGKQHTCECQSVK